MIGIRRKIPVQPLVLQSEANPTYNPYPVGSSNTVNLEDLKSNILSDETAVLLLKGQKGDTGQVGQTGQIGSKGDKGDKGDAGDSIIVKPTDPTDLTSSKVGDFYLNATSGTMYQRSGITEAQFYVAGLQGLVLPNSIWIKQGNLKGGTGAKGDIGVKGDKGDKGDTGESGVKLPLLVTTNTHTVTSLNPVIFVNNASPCTVTVPSNVSSVALKYVKIISKGQNGAVTIQDEQGTILIIIPSNYFLRSVELYAVNDNSYMYSRIDREIDCLRFAISGSDYVNTNTTKYIDISSSKPNILVSDFIGMGCIAYKDGIAKMVEIEQVKASYRDSGINAGNYYLYEHSTGRFHFALTETNITHIIFYLYYLK